MLWSREDDQLEIDFTTLLRTLQEPSVLNPALSDDPIFYFVYSPKQVLTVRSLMPGWRARLQNEAGLIVEILSLSTAMWEIVDASGRWEEWLEQELDFDQEEINAAMKDVLRKDYALVERVARLAQRFRSSTVLFLTDVELLHPYLRTRLIESYLNQRVQIPTVFFYPGRRSGEYGLHFLNFYEEDSGYRSKIIGGLG